MTHDIEKNLGVRYMQERTMSLVAAELDLLSYILCAIFRMPTYSIALSLTS